jgi:FkbM family methyltransferase
VADWFRNIRRSLGRRRRVWRRVPDTRWGIDFMMELRSRIGMAPQVIFDVGAHIGITAIQFSDFFPHATVFAFEPSSANFLDMTRNLVGKPDIRRYQIGFGASKGTDVLLFDPDHPSMARIGGSTGRPENVAMETIDGFCSAHSIDTVDILKLDTEGYELEVLRGAEIMLLKNRITIIKVECGVNPDIEYHLSLEDICDHLYPLGYRLFGFYDQWEDVFDPTPALRRVDAAFVSAIAIKEARQRRQSSSLRTIPQR